MASNSSTRIFQDGRNIALNMVLIVVIMLVAVGATGLCTFNPGKPEQGPVQEVDARTFLDMEARSVNFPVVYPEAPAGWVTNSARRAMIEQAPAPTVGWVTADGGYLQLTQTGAPLDKAVRGADQKPRELQRSVDVGGTEAQVYTSASDDVRDLWAVDAGQSRFLVTGAGTEEEFRALIEAALTAAPLPAQS
ncbi:hypothetical protein CKJ81_06340 [Corynebacterium hadale]|uniref:DUF4245 domain-containing protein n=2 Tax=Corynebacterium TaxID=1716 RepID=A0A269PD15_9CORY|nr:MULTISPECIES: DUF4245 domain-containing protein [Corynebacterium]MCG7253538.1 DUF4245 domain-containing protein [Corynebacterium hadale]MCG7255977.1 DUF4245 domain-containing protein [Corynebacterium hadale]MCG7265031.1 DUF4245 domain-containing protein [Corynebacterium hadale]PAJ69936.1 hypothetical protein CIG21_05720 [Corynebacterium hadale]PAT05834.1 hypothetical protein CKJ81_06340 [Corynebacterium hadale]